MSNETQLLFAIGYCIFMLLLFMLLIKHTPKKINYIYGYRTRLSMKNQATWDSANSFANTKMLQISYWSFLLPVFSYFIYPQCTVISTAIGNMFLIFWVVYATEKHLNTHFDKEGNPKQLE